MRASNDKTKLLLTQPVVPTLIRMAIPMMLGMTSIVMFNIVDTYFVGQLGAVQLAAMSFTFPVVFVVMSISMGMSIATTAVISRAIGTGDVQGMRRLTTHALALANALVILCGLIGLATIDPLFRALGADDNTLPLIREYMVPWYLGVGFLVIPMVGNGAIRATGDTKRPSYIMMFAGAINALLDPLLIFGWGFVPRLELQGAAIATVIGRSLTFLAALWILHKREKMLDLSWPKFSQVWHSWRQLLYIGAPAASARMLVPLSTGILTRMISEYGPNAVAAFGVGQRLESLVLIGIGALGAASAPFIGQNAGAAKFERIEKAISFGLQACLLWGLAVAIGLAFAAAPLAGLFNDQLEVQQTAIRFLWIVPISYGLYGVALLVIETLNALHQPLRAVVLISIRLFILTIPIAWIGSIYFEVSGIFMGIGTGNFLIGLFAWFVIRDSLRRLKPAVPKSDLRPHPPTADSAHGPTAGT